MLAVDPAFDHSFAELEALREPRALRPGERPHAFSPAVMADNPYQRKEHRAKLKSDRLAAIRKGADKPATLSGKTRRKPVLCVGAGVSITDTEARQGIGDVRCVDGTLRRRDGNSLSGLRRVAAEEHDACIVRVTEPKVREPKPPSHSDGTPKAAGEMTEEEAARYRRAVELYEREGRAMIQCIVFNAELDAAAMKPKDEDHDFDQPGVAKDRYGRDAFPVVYLR